MSLDAAEVVVESDAPVSWSAVLAGAVTSLAVSSFLTVLAAGFGYTLAPDGLATRGSLTGFSPVVGAGAVAAQCVSAALGGYLAGRLRPAWTAVRPDESHFRDTAHGLLAWAVSTVAGVVLAALVVAPYAAALAGAAAGGAPADPALAAHVAAQASFFTGTGMIVSAFVAAVAARLGGMQAEAAGVRRPA